MFREEKYFTVFEVSTGQEIDLQIEPGMSVSEIATSDRNVVYRQNGPFASMKNGKYEPIGYLVRDGKIIRDTVSAAKWGAFIVPKSGRPFIEKIDRNNVGAIKLAFQGTPQIIADGKKDIRTSTEGTPADVRNYAKRSAIGVKADGTVLLVTTKTNYSLGQLASLMLELGCIEALNLDGGGSVTYNLGHSPKQGYERPISSAIVVRKGVLPEKPSTGGVDTVKKPILVLDFGHGGSDPGAVNGEMKEKDYVLKIGSEVHKILSAEYNVNVPLTRADDTFVSLGDRAKLANRLGAKLFVSLHLNSFNSESNGFESFVYPNQSAKKTGQIRDIIHDQVASLLKEYNIRDRGKKEKDLQVLRDTHMDAVLLEYLFISNPTESALLRDDQFINKVARATAEGIAKAMNLSEKQTNEHWAKKDHDELLQAGLINSDHSHELDKPISWGAALSMINRIRKGEK
ncbi:N-acetylmuramoyl-L-alanine amidase [Brevibacillus daliensis]|uniref:N-acetylmuramoyl-L-alanine amidase n=1 Tax=Brevibacillus daliensis TaxID=2892995 RepID=UPI001E5CE963|nr:N-acetylmuramoyl-L-alanine amidase [Brevibacillus daliensis]